MPRMQVYLPDDLYNLVKLRGALVPSIVLVECLQGHTGTREN